MTAQILDDKTTAAAITSEGERIAAGPHRDRITRPEAGLVGSFDPLIREVAGWVAPGPGDVGPTRAMRGS